jgi:hypothetical protein
MRRTCGTIAALLLALTREASAQQAPSFEFPVAELDYRVAAGLACPTAEQLRADLTKEMHYDPFDGGAGVPVGRFHVTISRERTGILVVRVSFDDTSGKQDFETEFEGKPDTARTCGHLVGKHVVAEIAMQMTLQLSRLLRSPPPPPACSPSKPLPAAAPLSCPESPYSVWPREPPMLGEPEPPKPPERWPVAVRLGVAVWPELIAAGFGSLGFSVEAGVRYKAFSAGIEAHGDPPLGSQSFQFLGAVSFARVSGALVLCAHYGWFVGCGVGDAGRILFPNHIIPYLPASVLYGAAGVRAGFELPVAPPRLFFSTTFDLRAPIHPASYAPRGNEIFRVAGPSVGLGLGLRLELPP